MNLENDELMRQNIEFFSQQSPQADLMNNYENINYFLNLHNEAKIRQLKLELKTNVIQQDILQQANKTKIGYRSEMIMLKKLQTNIQEAIDEFQEENKLNYDQFVALLTKLGLDYYSKEFKASTQSLWELFREQEYLCCSKIFNVLVVLLENSLTQKQSISLIEKSIASQYQFMDNTLEWNKIKQQIAEIVQVFKHFQIGRPQSSKKPEIQEVPLAKPKLYSSQHKKQDRFSILYDQSKLLQQKKRKLELLQQEDPECSFKPQVNNNKQLITRCDNTFEILYQNAHYIQQKKNTIRDEMERQKAEVEVQECTFKPKLSIHNYKKQPTVKGENQVVERMQKARLLKEEKENYYQDHHQLESFKQRITKPIPFELSKTQHVKSQSEIYLYLDIRISKLKKGMINQYILVRIAIRKEDSALSIASGLQKTYSLNQEQFLVLLNTIEQYIR